MESSTNSVEIIRYTIPLEAGPAFEKAWMKAGIHLQASPFCLGYQVLHGSEEPGNYLVMIHWTSEADHLQGFRRSGDFPPFLELVKPYYSAIAEMKHYLAAGINFKR